MGTGAVGSCPDKDRRCTVRCGALVILAAVALVTLAGIMFAAGLVIVVTLPQNIGF